MELNKNDIEQSLNIEDDVKKSATEHVEVVPRLDNENEVKQDGKSPKDDPLDYLTAAERHNPEDYFLTGWRFWVALVGILSAELIPGLGGNMVVPAFAGILNRFNAATMLGWVGGSFYMTQAPCMLFFGQFLSFFPAKTCLLANVVIFMIGSSITGGAQSIGAVIAGRAVCGIAASGIWVGGLVTISTITPLSRRPLIIGCLGGTGVIANTAGPPLAGYLATKNWRLCFLFILPICLVAMTVIYFAIPNGLRSAPPTPDVYERVDARWAKFSKKEPKRNGILYRLIAIDWVGFWLTTAAIVFLEVGIQWGGVNYPWISYQVLCCILLGFGGCTGVFIAWSKYLGKAAMMPTRLFTLRSQWGVCIISFLALYLQLVAVIMFPYFFEVILNHSSTLAGYELLPYNEIAIVGAIFSGWVSTKTGYWWHWFMIAPFFIITAGVLTYFIQPTVTAARLIGYETIIALGYGLMNPIVYVAPQAESAPADVHLRIAVVSYTQLFGGAVAPTVSSALLTNLVTSNLAKYAPTAPASVIDNTAVIWTLEQPLRDQVLKAYTKALNVVFLQWVGVGAVIWIAAAALVRPTRLTKEQRRTV